MIRRDMKVRLGHYSSFGKAETKQQKNKSFQTKSGKSANKNSSWRVLVYKSRTKRKENIRPCNHYQLECTYHPLFDRSIRFYWFGNRFDLNFANHIQNMVCSIVHPQRIPSTHGEPTRQRTGRADTPATKRRESHKGKNSFRINVNSWLSPGQL